MHRAAGWRVAGLLGELAPGHHERVLAGGHLAFRERPGARVAPGPDRTARMDNEDLEPPWPLPVERQARAQAHRGAVRCCAVTIVADRPLEAPAETRSAGGGAGQHVRAQPGAAAFDLLDGGEGSIPGGTVLRRLGEAPTGTFE